MKKIICAVIFSLVLGFMYSQSSSEKIRVGVLNGPSAVPAAQLMETSKICEISKYADPQALLPKLIKKEVDIGFLPVNVAAKVYNSSRGAIICTAVTGNGNLSVISTENIKRFSDLKDKVVYVAGQGATPEYMLRYLLQQNNLTPDKNVFLDFSIPTAQIAANLISGKIKYAVVPEPFATIAEMKSDKVHKVLDLQKEYKAFIDIEDNYPLTVMVVTKSFAENNSDLLEAFLEEYKAACEWTVENTKAAGQLVEKHDLGLTAAVVTKSIPSANYVYIPAKQAQTKIELLLNLFLEYSPESIGSVLPAQDFYYEKENTKL